MTRLRKFVAYRNLERPYTRYSKYKQQCYVRARPVCKVVSFDLGDLSHEFEFNLTLVSKSGLQIRDNAIEAARQTSNRLLEKTLGKNGYVMKVRIYPHHILRENPLASGAGADRMSTGMAHNYGKPIGIAAQVRVGQPLFSLKVNKENMETARLALKRASYKLPCSCTILTEKNSLYKAPEAKPVEMLS
ncbi:50S ribosomal protein L16 [Candidatus Woesearchaeota archaeon]|nr:50S ribosomal protein L16 [Candidatus Woesearchaeota archaeon]